MARDGAVARPGAQRWVPARPALPALRSALHECRGCELYRDATQAVFSTGRTAARLMLVGEQPGDREDLAGRPFVGPAGRLLDEAIEAAGLVRGELYLTNAVKHFRFEERGKRRIHKTPDVPHIVACRPWLEAELAAVRHAVIVCLGAVAARAVFGKPMRITAERGKVLEAGDRIAVVTTHPSAVVRLHGDPDFPQAFDALVHDLVVAAEAASNAVPVSKE